MISSVDIAVALGRSLSDLDQTEIDRWSMWIDEARLLIEDRLGDLSLLNQAKLDYVTRLAVVDMVRNPDNMTQVDVTVDGMGVSKRYTTSAGRVTILDGWWKMLTPTQSGGSGAFSIDLYCGDRDYRR